jgi:class 3 adenylate cyclase
MEEAGFVGEVWDADWRLAYLTDDYQLAAGTGAQRAENLALGEHLLSTATVETRLAWKAGPTLEAMRASVADWGGMLLSPAPDARAELLAVADERFHDVITQLEPTPMPPAWVDDVEVRFGTTTTRLNGTRLRLSDDDGRIAGSLLIAKPALRGAVLGMLGLGDEGLFERMLDLTVAQRRPLAILFADLEASTALSRRLSAAGYFALLRRMVRGADAGIVAAEGVVGKHAGDGITAFFLAQPDNGESAAAASAIASVRAIREAAANAARHTGLDPSEVVMRFGLHWGATVHVGRLVSAGRIEITAIGDEVNEAARIEACATGGLALASKALIERLTPADARVAGVDLGRVRYTTLQDLPTASEKARRDAPALSVCEL